MKRLFFVATMHFFIGIKTIITTKTKIYSSGKTSVSKDVDETTGLIGLQMNGRPFIQSTASLDVNQWSLSASLKISS